MAKWIYMVATNCDDPSRESEYNEWYSNVHQPDLVQRIPSFVKATRFELARVVPPVESRPGMPKFAAGPNASDVPKYLAIYEFEADDVDEGISDCRTVTRQLGEEGRMNPLPVVVSRIAYRQVSPSRVKASQEE